VVWSISYFKYKWGFCFCRITFPVRSGKGKKRKDADGEEDDTEEAKTLIVEPHVIPNRGPYPYNQPKR
jgi:intron-binding protein aquarius